MRYLRAGALLPRDDFPAAPGRSIMRLAQIAPQCSDSRLCNHMPEGRRRMRTKPRTVGPLAI